MTYDVVSFGETMLRLTAPSGVRLEDAQTFQRYVAGTESNTLACLSRLGLRCAWLSALPNNPIGSNIERELRRHGVDTSHVVWADAAARVGTFYAEELAGPLGVNVVYDRAGSACAQIDPDAVDLSIVEGARLLHLTGITPALGDSAGTVFARLLRRAQEHDIPISFDVNYRAKLWSTTDAAAGIEAACRAATVLFCTRDDAADLWGFAGSAEQITDQIAARFGEDDSGKTIVLTLGQEGAAQLQNGVFTTEPVFPSAGTARFGSGDAFAAGYLYAYLDGPLYAQMRDGHGANALIVGNAAAALKRSIAGDMAVITPDELLTVVGGAHGRRFR